MLTLGNCWYNLAETNILCAIAVRNNRIPGWLVGLRRSSNSGYIRDESTVYSVWVIES